MSADSYRLDGTWISLDRAPEISFLVTEPGPANIAFQAATFDALPRGFHSETSKPSVMMLAQREAFLAVCVRECRGLGNGNGPPDFRQWLSEHPRAIEELWDKAVAQGKADEAWQSDVLGNSAAASPGS